MKTAEQIANKVASLEDNKALAAIYHDSGENWNRAMNKAFGDFSMMPSTSNWRLLQGCMYEYQQETLYGK